MEKSCQKKQENFTDYYNGIKTITGIPNKNGAESLAIIYSIVEIAKANWLKPYEYVAHLLTEIPKHMDDKNKDFLKKLQPQS